MEQANASFEESFLDEFIENDDDQDQGLKEFLDLFEKLDRSINGELIEKAWSCYNTVLQQIILEGDKRVWQACAFYTTALQSTIDGGEPVYKYSLSKLLCICETSILEYFDKLDKWVEIISASTRVLDHITRIQSCLATSAVTYKKFLLIFRRIFIDQNVFHSTPTKQRRTDLQIKTADLLEFLWKMFIALKKEILTPNENLLNSFHLLLCVIDHIFCELRVSNKTSLLNSEFITMVEATNKEVLEILCDEFEGVVLDAKHFRSHFLLPSLSRMVEEKILRTKDPKLLTMTSNFHQNKASFETIYEQGMIARGENDERFLLAPALKNIDLVFNEGFSSIASDVLRQNGQSQKREADHLVEILIQNCLLKIAPRDQFKPSRASKAFVIAQNQYCLKSSLKSIKNVITTNEKLAHLTKGNFIIDLDVLINGENGTNPSVSASSKVFSHAKRIFGRIASEAKSKDYDNEFTFLIDSKRKEIEALFYRFLYKVLQLEISRKHIEERRIEALLDRIDFISSIFVCSLELVLFFSNYQFEFPRSADIVGVSVFSFYKIIEIVVVADTELSRDAIQHLNTIETRVLEELIWKPNSSLCSILSSSENQIPCSSMLRNTKCSRKSNLSPHLAFFFQKLYHLAAMRISDLCERIKMDSVGRQRVWTLFEHILRNETPLMFNHHLDQNLMCCIYTVSKISNYEITFHDIIYYYRQQPQAQSRVYRQVLMDHQNISSQTIQIQSYDDSASRDLQISDPGNLYRWSVLPAHEITETSQPTTEALPHFYGDLIKYYNRIFIPRVQEFARNLLPNDSLHDENHAPELVSIPRLTSFSLPRNLTNYVTLTNFSSLGARPLRYEISRTSCKDLNAINSVAREDGTPDAI